MARASKPCPTCTALITDGRARCPTCLTTQRRQSRQRNGRNDRVYSTAKWKRRRAQKLARNPTCEYTDSRGACSQPAEVVDHEPPRQQLVAAHVHDPDHMRWLVALCKPHHDAKTATSDGGFGRTAVPRDLDPNLDHTA